MSSLNIALFELSDTHVLVYTFSSAITLSFYSSTCPLYMGNMIMSPTCQINLVVLSASQKMPWVIFVSCLLFKDLSLHLLIILIPIIILFEYYLCLPSHIQFLVTLVICWRIHCLPHHSKVSHQYFLKTKTQSFDDGTLGFTIITGELLCFSCQFHSLSDILLSSFHVRLQHIYSHGKDCTGSFGFG